MCPVCTVAIAGGLGLSRILGIDDLISGLWIGALILSLSFVTINWIKKRYNRAWVDYAVIIAMYLMVLLPLNRMGGGTRLIAGAVIGSVVFLLGVEADKYIKKIKGKQLVVYQKVIVPVLALLIASLIAYGLIK